MSEPVVEIVRVEADDVFALRRLVGEGFTDQELAEVLALNVLEDGSLDMNTSAADLWGRKAAETADLVDVTENGSSRKLSDLHKNALAMQKHFMALANPGVAAGEAPVRRSRTRAIVRD